MKKNYFSIGEVSKIKGVSIRTLRFYDKIGLFKPTYVDPDTGYRYYGIEQFLTLENILLFKSTGASLNEIKQVIHEETSQKVGEFCFRQIQNARLRIEELQDGIIRFQKLMEGVYLDKSYAQNVRIEQVKLPPRLVVSHECHTPPTHEDTYAIYFAMYNEVYKRSLSTILATGSEIDFDIDTLDIQYKRVFVEVYERPSSIKDGLMVLPGGTYLSTHYFAWNKDEQLRRFAQVIKEMGLHPKTIYEADTFYTISSYKNPLMNIQALISEQ